jgi:hypothetical protein
MKGDYKVTILLGTIKTTGLAPVAAPGIIPGPNDSISVPPPNQTTPIAGVVVDVVSLTQAAVTLHVRGEGL